MIDSIHDSLLSLFLPDRILEYFDITNYEVSPTGQKLYTKTITLDLEEKMIVPAEYAHYPIKASGFMETRNVDDYPIRDMLVKLRVKRRRWDVLIEGKYRKVSRDWDLVSQGSRMSEDYSAFLKGLG